VTIAYSGTRIILPRNTPKENSGVNDIITGKDKDNAARVSDKDFETADGR